MIDALKKHALSEFTRAEFLEFLNKIILVKTQSEAEHKTWVQHFATLIEPHPNGTDLIYWPDGDADTSPEGIASEIDAFCAKAGIQCFKH